jgi:hypothetical protein
MKIRAIITMSWMDDHAQRRQAFGLALIVLLILLFVLLRRLWSGV